MAVPSTTRRLSCSSIRRLSTLSGARYSDGELRHAASAGTGQPANGRGTRPAPQFGCTWGAGYAVSVFHFGRYGQCAIAAAAAAAARGSWQHPENSGWAAKALRRLALDLVARRSSAPRRAPHPSPFAWRSAARVQGASPVHLR